MFLNNRIIFQALIIALLFFAACKHEPEMLPGTNTNGNSSTSSLTCNDDTVYFKNTIQPLLSASCAYSGCHDAGAHESGVILDSYQNIMNTADVRPGNADGSDLYEVITENDEDKIMPRPPASPLTSTQINLIYTWIMQGAKNNGCEECDSVNVTYSGAINTIFQNNCVSCHSGSNPVSGILLTDYANVSALAQTGQLAGAVTHASGYKPMPQGSPKLPDCQVNQITKWVNDGFPNN